VRLLQVIETGGPGGAETVFANLTTCLVARGHEVHALIAPGSWLPDEMVRRGLAANVVSSRGALDVALLRTMRGLIRSRRIDVVHAHLFDGAVYASLAARLEGVPCVATLHGQVDVARAGWRSAVKRALFSRSVSAVVTVSDALRRDLAGRLHLPAARTHVIPNGVEAGPPPLPIGARPRGHRVVALGNIRRAKDYPTMLDALALLRERLPDVHLDIAGEPDQEGLHDGLLAQVARLSLAPHVTLLGFVADPRPLLARADAFVLSSSEEGFSIATIEAMLAGVPVVATRSGGPEEILRHDGTGLLVPTRDPAALAAALERVLTDDALAGRLTAAARDDAMARFGMERMVEAYERIYATAVQGRR
jgi:glycosyltransferase involved in cell wall biosynthesis